MIQAENILISLEARYAEGILSGAKRVELRRRHMNVAQGTIVWLYVKQPVASVVGCATVRSIHKSAPSVLWKRFGAVAGISKTEFFDYFAGVRCGLALSLDRGMRLPDPISLKQLRTVTSTFHPPQFFVRLDARSPVLHAISNG